MSQDLTVYGILACAVAIGGVGIAYAVAHRQAQARLEAAQTEIRRLKQWGAHWHSETVRFERELNTVREAPSRRGRHARRCQMDQHRARIAATTAALREAA